MQNCITRSKQILEFKPKFDKQNITYEREEKQGWVSIAFNSKVDYTPMLITKYDRDFIELCNGENRVIDIVGIVSRKNNIPWMESIMLSNRLLALLTELQMLQSDPNNPFINRKSVYITENIIISEVSYIDYNECKAFINNAFSGYSNYYFYMNPINNGLSFSINDFHLAVSNLDNRCFIIRADSFNLGVVTLNKSAFSNEYILDSIILSKNLLTYIKLDQLNHILSPKNNRIIIFSITRSEEAICLFNPPEKEEFLLKNELDKDIDLFETINYYWKTEN